METFAAPRAGGPRRRLGMLAVLGALSSFGPLSMDMYLPSTPTIAASLHASQSLVQLTLSGCLAGLAIGQLIAGPLSDGLGRKRPLLAGLVAFTLLSVACAAAPDIGALVVFRFLQGVAGAGGVVLSLTIVRDLYEGTELAITLGNAALICYISALPFIVEDAYHESPQIFSLFFMINAIGLTTMAQLGARLVKRVPVTRIVVVSLIVMAVGCDAFLVAALTRHPPLAALLIPLFFFIACFGSMRPNATAIALANQGAIAGTASAWTGALPFLLGALLSPLAGLGGAGGAVTAAILLAVLCTGALASPLIARGNRRAAAPTAPRAVGAAKS